MGADNLAQLPRWRDWRDIARLMPIAVIARPGYNGRTHAVQAMGWLRRFVRPTGQTLHLSDWRPPALVFLRFLPDVRSPTSIQHGRPPCRERGCKYVYILVVTGFIKKQ